MANQKEPESSRQPEPENSNGPDKATFHESATSDSPVVNFASLTPNMSDESEPLPTTNANVSSVSRYVSFGLLLGVILIFILLFYGVMAKFLIPLFLAALLVVVFRPLHQWILKKCGGRQRIGAMLTTAAVMLTVLVPISLILMLAAAEGRTAYQQFNTSQIFDGVSKIRTNLNLDLPQEVRVIESELAAAQQNIGLGPRQEDEHRQLLFDVHESAKKISHEKGLPWPDISAMINPDDENSADEDRTDQKEVTEKTASSPDQSWEKFATEIQLARKIHAEMDWTLADSKTEQIVKDEKLHKYQMMLNKTADHFHEFRPTLLGGKSKAVLVDLVNPSDDDTRNYIDNGVAFLKDNFVGLSKTGASFLGNLILGTAIMTIGLYFFLLDGPRMIESFKGLSPIDDAHEEELISEFGNVSRAVVVATLLSALVQGLLAGIGFYFAGLDSIFLLTVLSAVLAMVPFVGAAAVWVPCSLYLYFFENNLTAAIGLAIYGAAVISMADNVIKPFVLHGQSNLHPLLALLSVLGGVAALGPIGILIGPMVVAFLQTLLKILQREMRDLDRLSRQNQQAAAVASPSGTVANND